MNRTVPATLATVALAEYGFALIASSGTAYAGLGRLLSSSWRRLAGSSRRSLPGWTTLAIPRP